MALPNTEPLRQYLKQELEGQGPPLDELDYDWVLATILEYLYASNQSLNGFGLLQLPIPTPSRDQLRTFDRLAGHNID